jgi:hypothetical protein
MPGRVLNFNEFSDKYSSGSNEPSNIDDIKNASSNFEEGFDDDTYDQPQIGPNRPVSGNYETTPASPGEEGSPAFSSQNTQEMNAPEEMESDEPENEESEEEESEEEETDEVEEGNPEAGANPKKKVEEGFTLVKGFSQFVNENHEDYSSQKDNDLSLQAEEAVDSLTYREKKILSEYLESNPEEFNELVKDEIEDLETGSNPRERDYESLGMDENEFKVRKIIHKILGGITIGAGLSIIPAAMFISGGVAAALGVASLLGATTKDAAFWKRGGHHYKAQDQAEYEDFGSNPWEDDEYFEDYDHDHDEDDDTCHMCGEVPISNEYGYSCGCNM